MKIAVYAIAKNEATHVERFMASLADADLVIVTDTGSTDDTVALLGQHGAVVHEISIDPWRFDTARNVALDLVPTDVDVCIALDLDEIPLAGWRGHVEEAWQPGVTAMSFHYIWGLSANGEFGSSFLRNNIHARHGYRWRNIVHEVLESSGPARLVPCGMQVLHLQDLSKPRAQYLPLLQIATAEEPSAFQLSCWLGREYMTAGRNDEALTEFERYLTIPEATWQPERAAVLEYMRGIWLARGDIERAFECQRRACQEAPFEREPWVALAQLCHDYQRWDEGCDAAERALTITERGYHYLIRSDAWAERPADLASICAWNLGQHDRARGHVIAALALAPHDERIAANAVHMGIGHVRVVEPAPVPDPASAAPLQHPDSPFLVSVTLTGNASDLIGDALASVVDWVDACLVIDTGVTDETLSIAREVTGSKYREMAWAWQDDFAAARNTALDTAAALGAQWAVMVDTDERMLPGPALSTLRDTLLGTTADLLLVDDIGGHYGKERFFRLPRRGQYVGPTHEAYVATSLRDQLTGMRFMEVPKTPEQYHAKFVRDLDILSRHVEEHPDDPRWHYYLGDTLQNLGRHEEAIPAFECCHALPGWDDQAAWAAYRAAECALVLNEPNSAVQWCARGLARHAGVAELAWLAGYASWQAGRPGQAAAWARMAIATGAFAGHGTQERIGFRNPMALYEGPYDVLRFALRALGDEEGADEAERMFAAAQSARQIATNE